MEYVLVGVGGALGSLTRFWVGWLIVKKAKTIFPLGTFIINITGALLLGIISGVGLGEKPYALLGDGFLGAYTTFSTFMYEGFSLFRNKEKLNAVIYIFASVIIGIVGFSLGYSLTGLL